MVSKIKKVLSRRTSLFSKTITHTNANPVQIRYMGSVIHAGVTSSKRSRIVPPPIAVTKPTTYAPNQSNRLADAKRIPLIAKANVPIKSSI